MRRFDPGGAVAQELQYLGREQPHRADRQAVRAVIVLLILPDRLEIGAKDEGRTVDEEDMVAGTDGAVGLGHAPVLAEAAGEGYRSAREARRSAQASPNFCASPMRCSFPVAPLGISERNRIVRGVL